MRIGFITDTNILTKRNGKEIEKLISEKSFLNRMDLFINYTEDYKRSKRKYSLDYIVPEIVIEELKNQKISAYTDSYMNLLERYKKIGYGLSGNIPENNIKNYVEEEINSYKEKVKVLYLDYTAELFEEIVDDALKKKAPFDKSSEGQKTDSGFKDALIWKTLLRNKEINDYDKLYFFSGDKIFETEKENLESEFKSYHNNTELILKYIEPDDERIQNCLKILVQENNLPETDTVKLYNKQKTLLDIHNMVYKYDRIVKMYGVVSGDEEITLKNIPFNEFTLNDFMIVNIEVEGDYYISNIRFITKKYELNPQDIPISERRRLIGEIKNTYEKKNNKFVLSKSEIVKLKFEQTWQEKMQSIYSNIQEVMEGLKMPDISKISKNIADSLYNYNYYTDKLLLNNNYLDEYSEKKDNSEEDEDENSTNKV